MAEKENKAAEGGLDFTMFIGDEGANILSTEQLKDINKKLPKWNIEPPSKYKAGADKK